jgi:hypothetical protein
LSLLLQDLVQSCLRGTYYSSPGRSRGTKYFGQHISFLSGGPTVDPGHGPRNRRARGVHGCGEKGAPRQARCGQERAFLAPAAVHPSSLSSSHTHFCRQQCARTGTRPRAEAHAAVAAAAACIDDGTRHMAASNLCRESVGAPGAHAKVRVCVRAGRAGVGSCAAEARDAPSCTHVCVCCCVWCRGVRRTLGSELPMTARTHRVETAGIRGGQCRGHDQKPLPTPCFAHACISACSACERGRVERGKASD